MFGAYAAAAVILAASVVIGLALWRLSGWERASFCAPAGGYAVLLIACGITARLPGRTVTSAAVVAVLAALSLLVVFAEPYPRGAALSAGLPLAVVSLALTALPFIVSGRFGVLGMGDNDDMSFHMGAAYWLQTHAIQQDLWAVKPGYPLGPHAIAGTLGTGLGISVEEAFAAVMLVVPPLAVLAAYGGLDRLGRAPRLVGALLTGFAYLAASYLAQGAFKETILGLLLLAFALGLREFAGELHWPQARQAVPFGVIAAATFYVYSYPGAFWPAAALLAAWAAVALRGGLAGVVARAVYVVRDAAWPLAAGFAAFLVAVAPDIGRVIHFSSSSYAHEPKHGLGNLHHPLSPVTALGVWLQPDFRFDPHPYWLTVIGIALAAGALVWALFAWWRDDDVIVPAAILAAVAVWAISTRVKNPYNAAKALAIMSPLVMLAITSVLLAPRRELRFARPGIERLRIPVALVVTVLAAVSSFLALRDAPVGTSAHIRELGSFRPAIARQRTLVMMDDDFALWELRDAIVVRPRFLYSPTVVRLRLDKGWRAGQPLDFDAFDAATLDTVRYVVKPRTPFTSQAPPNFKLVATTPSYELWRREGPTPQRQILREDGQPAATLRCTNRRPRGVAHVLPTPVIGRPSAWSPTVKGAGQSATQQLRLPSGEWDISIQYVSRQDLTLSSPAGLRATLPATLDRMGPYFLAGTVRSDGRTPVTITARTAKLPVVGRLLGSSGNTHALNSPGNLPLGSVVATRHGRAGVTVPLARACGRYVDWYRTAA